MARHHKVVFVHPNTNLKTDKTKSALNQCLADGNDQYYCSCLEANELLIEKGQLPQVGENIALPIQKNCHILGHSDH